MKQSIPYSRLFYENYLPGAVAALRGNAYAQVVGSDSDPQRVKQIDPQRLQEVALEYLSRWKDAGGEIDEPLQVAVREREFVICVPTTIYVSPYPLTLRCTGARCRIVETADRIPRAGRLQGLARRILRKGGRILCRQCKAPLEQLSFVQVHRCGRLTDLELPFAARRGRPLRFHDEGTFQRSFWTDFNTHKHLGSGFGGACPICTPRHKGTRGTRTSGTKVRGGRTESFNAQLVQFLTLRPQTTALLASFGDRIPDPKEMGRALVCGLLDLMDGPTLRKQLHSAVGGVPGAGRGDAAALEREREKLQKDMQLLRNMPGMESVMHTLEEKVAAIAEQVRQARGLFIGADAYLNQPSVLERIGASTRAAESVLIRGEFVERSLHTDILAARPAQRLLLEDTQSCLLEDYGVREVRHIKHLAVVVAALGFTRQSPEPRLAPGEVPLRLNAFGDDVTPNLAGKVPIYTLPNETECVHLRLDPCRVLRWAIANLGWVSPPEEVLSNGARAHAHILMTAPMLAASLREIEQAALLGTDPHATHIVGLLHTLLHVTLRAATEESGYDLHTLVEYLFPLDLAAVIYVNSKKQYTMGGLQTLFEYGLLRWFELAAQSTITCIYDPTCSLADGGACHGCVHLPLNCQTFNAGLSRAYLHGGEVIASDGQRLFVQQGFWT